MVGHVCMCFFFFFSAHAILPYYDTRIRGGWILLGVSELWKANMFVVMIVIIFIYD